MTKTGSTARDKWLEQIEQTLFELVLREGELRELVNKKETLSVGGQFVVNSRSGCWHELAGNGTTTRCGWSFQGAPHERKLWFQAEAWFDVCDRCMPLRRRAIYRRHSGRIDAEPESADE